MNMTKKISQDQKEDFRLAVENLDVFTQLKISCLDIDEKGCLVARTELLEKIRSRCLNKIAFFAPQIRKEQEKRLLKMKKVILQSCDIIQSQIEKFKEGDDSHKQLANSASIIIQRYNAIVAQKNPLGKAKPDTYGYEREKLLQDQDIKGIQIGLPHAVSIKHELHSSANPVYKTFKELSHVLRVRSVQEESLSISPTHKKSEQLMIDMFHMKAIRMIELHLKKSIAEIVPLVKQTLPCLDEESNPELILMEQRIKVNAGTIVLVKGCFKRHPSPSQLMAMPVPESFHLTFLYGKADGLFEK